jgi:hypothetical protein
MKTAKNGLYYGWIVVAITAITMIISAGLRSAPGVMLQAIEADTGWTRNLISFAVSLGVWLGRAICRQINGYLRPACSDAGWPADYGTQ